MKHFSLALRIIFSVVSLWTFAACASFFEGRPAQEMSDTAAAMRAAREVQAPLLSPVLYGRAREYWDRSKRAFKFKDFKVARFFALRARKLAEEAEFESVCCRGGQRNSVNVKDPMADEMAQDQEAEGSSQSSPDAGLLDDQDTGDSEASEDQEGGAPDVNPESGGDQGV